MERKESAQLIAQRQIHFRTLISHVIHGRVLVLHLFTFHAVIFVPAQAQDNRAATKEHLICFYGMECQDKA